MKKSLTLLLAVVLFLSFSACSGQKDAPASTSTPTNNTQNTTEGTDEGAATPPTEPTATQHTEVTTPTTQPTTEPAPTVPSTTEPLSQDWQTAYQDFLEGAKDHHVAFALIYVDGDDIPELYLNGDCEATGDALCTYKNGQVIEQRLRRTWGGSYIPGTGLIKNTNGNMGYYTTDIYALTGSGFASIWNGLEVQEFAPPANEDEEMTITCTFSIGDQTVSEKAYYAAIEEVFRTSQAVQLHEDAVSFDAIRQQLLEN